MALDRLGEPGALVRRARDGDGAAWARLVEGYSDLLWSVARTTGLSNSDAADAVQTTWLRLVEHLDRIRDPDAVGGWLISTVRHESLRLVRHRPPPPDERPAEHSATEQVVLAREHVCRVGSALRAMQPRCRNLLRLLAAAPSYAELSAVLDLPVGSIGPTRARCLAELSRRLSA
ncbi:RNA polymerase sigma factor [Actinomadura hibisca]|uniref:RNA polymerase sigma factor n=1 Tax=Actinomadura hibisca TaxID=68565 RepID=UPI000A82AD81|nr:sigma-70 family RNA polymerase sigma factor [Actinomadura hibisca]